MAYLIWKTAFQIQFGGNLVFLFFWKLDKTINKFIHWRLFDDLVITSAILCSILGLNFETFLKLTPENIKEIIPNLISRIMFEVAFKKINGIDCHEDFIIIDDVTPSAEIAGTSSTTAALSLPIKLYSVQIYAGMVITYLCFSLYINWNVTKN